MLHWDIDYVYSKPVASVPECARGIVSMSCFSPSHVSTRRGAGMRAGEAGWRWRYGQRYPEDAAMHRGCSRSVRFARRMCCLPGVCVRAEPPLLLEGICKTCSRASHSNILALGRAILQVRVRIRCGGGRSYERCRSPIRSKRILLFA